MNIQEELTPIERKWSEMLPGHRGGDCLEAEELIELAETLSPSPSSKMMQHVLYCSVCQARLMELRRVEQMRPIFFQDQILLPGVGRVPAKSDLQSRPVTQNPTSPSPRNQPRFDGPPILPLSIPSPPVKNPAPGRTIPDSAARPIADRFGASPAILVQNPMPGVNPATQNPAHYAPPVPQASGMVPRSSPRNLRMMRWASIGGLAATIILGIFFVARQSGQSHSLSGSSTDSPTLLDPRKESQSQPLNSNTPLTNEPIGQVAVVGPTTAAPSDAVDLQWKAFPGATRYRVRVVERSNENSSFAPMERSFDSSDGTWWKLPLQTLKSGKTYEWSIEAYKGQVIIAKASSTFKCI